MAYRAFLHAVHEEFKDRSGGRFSYAEFSSVLGYNAPNHAFLVLQGKRSLTEETAARIAQRLGLNTFEIEYFVQLRRLEDARDGHSRADALRRLLHVKTKGATATAGAELEAFLDDSLNTIVFEALGLGPGPHDPKSLARRIVPRARTSDVVRALTTLESIGLVRREQEGYVRLKDRVATSATVTSLRITDYYKQMLDRAADAVIVTPAARRAFASLTIALPPEALDSLKELVERFKMDVLALQGNAEQLKHVFQVGVQIFPVVTSEEEG